LNEALQVSIPIDVKKGTVATVPRLQKPIERRIKMKLNLPELRLILAIAYAIACYLITPKA
jgi:hypothetical protein